MKYLLKLLKKILSVTIIITLFNLLIPNTIISNGVYDEKILKKILRTIKKRSPILEKQVLTLKKMLSIETHRNRILEDLKQFSGGEQSDPWKYSKLSEMYVYKVFKKLDIPMEKMLICSEDVFWYLNDQKESPTKIVNLLNPVSLIYIVQGSTLNTEYNKGLFKQKIFKNNKYTDKLNEVLEILKSFQTIQHDAFNENVEDELSFPSTSGSKSNYRISSAGFDLNGIRVDDCSEKKINKYWAKARGSGMTILFLAVTNTNVCLMEMLLGNFGVYMEDLSKIDRIYNPLENTSEKYLRIISNMYKYYDVIGIPDCYKDNDFGKRSFAINQYIKQNYVEEEEINVDDLK